MRVPTFSIVTAVCCIVAAAAFHNAEATPENETVSSAAPSWAQRRQEVVTMLRKCWESYRKDAFGADVYHPLSHRGDWFGPNKRGIGFTIADSLDTLLMAGLRTEYEQGRDWISSSLSFNIDASVSLFETTIRVLGGLLSGYTLSGDKILLERARELGDRLLPAYATPSGLPYPLINLATGKGSYFGGRGEVVGLAEVGTLQLEMRELSRLTGNPKYWEAAKRADDPGFTIQGYTMGAVADSYYEYLLKQWMQSSKTNNSMRQRYDAAMQGMRKHLVKVSPNNRNVFVGDIRDDGSFSSRMEHLTCFIGGTLALGAMNDRGNPARAKSDLELAASITDTCVKMYTSMPTGLSPEIVRIRESRSNNAGTTDMYVASGETYNILRPETLESLFLMWRATGNVKYREQAWAIFEAFKKHALTPDGNCFTSLRDVTKVPAVTMDVMESFLIAETFKYLILIFDDSPNALPLDRYVLTTEAHPLPIFKA
ncbi:glycoside hydrolase [Syncephalis fuscata]|nr:glycoside hydrolase [Syncephalis fuscata]